MRATSCGWPDVPGASQLLLRRDGFGLREEQEVVATAGFGVGAGHVEAAEGVDADERAGTLAIEVEVADVEVLFGLLDAFRVGRVERAGQAVFGLVGDVHGILEVPRFDEGQHGTEDLFLGDARVRVDIGYDGWLEEVAGAVMAAACHEAALGLANLDVIVDLLEGVGVNNWPHVGCRLRDIAHRQLLCLLNHAIQHVVIDGLDDDGAGACGTLLALKPKAEATMPLAAASRSAVS